MKKVVYFLFLVTLFISCQKNKDAVASDEKIMACKVASSASSDKYDAVAVDSAAVALDMPDKESSEEIIEPKIIKNGDIRFETDDLEKSYNQVQDAVKKYGATIKNDNEGKDYQSVFRNLIIRIPSKNFDAFIKDISNGVNYFDRKEISSDDVTEEYIDVASRIKTKKVLEERYLELLKKATKVSEMLEVERQLSQIREEIEAKEGRLKYIQNRVALSTLNIEMYKTVAEKGGATVSFGTKFINAIKSGFNGISSFFIWLIEMWPFILILVALIYFIRKKFKKKFNKQNV